MDNKPTLQCYTARNTLLYFASCRLRISFYDGAAMHRYFTFLVCAALITSLLPITAAAQTVEKKTPRKYDKLLTAVESFAKLNAQIEIREREYALLTPFVQDVVFYADQLKTVCDMKCYKSANNFYPRLKNDINALYEAHRRYQAMTPAITERNAALMGEIQRVEFLPVQLSKEKAMAALNQLNLENLYHYKAYASTYHSADRAMLSLAATSDLTTIIGSFATTTDRLANMGRVQPMMSDTVQTLKNKVPDIRAQMKTLEDRRKSLVCTATLAQDYSVAVHCTP